MPRPKRVFDGENGFEIRGFSEPEFRRKQLIVNETDIDLDVPNGDLEYGRRVYNQNCGGCHDLDGDFDQGPALRTVYLRRLGQNKKFSNYGYDLRARRLYWTRRLLWEFIEAPEKMFPDTNMQFDGIQDPFTIASVIDYIQYLRVFTADNRMSKRPIY